MTDTLETVLRLVKPSEAEFDAAERLLAGKASETALEADRRHARLRLDAIEQVPVHADLRPAIADDQLMPTQALQAVRAWRDSSKPGGKPTLVLVGGVGAGKTVAAAWAMAHAHSSAYAKMRDVANMFRAGFGDDAERFRRLLSVSLLVVDELGTERDRELGAAALHELIDERQAGRRATLLISNLSKANLKGRYDIRTIDRLREGAAVVELADKSMRRGAAW